MNKKIKVFLDEICIHINCKTVHKDIREELCEHIDELMKENINNGYDEEEALDLAICAMGSTDEIGTKLNRQHKPQIEWSILILTAIIAVIGAVVIFSSSKFADGRAIDFSRYILFVVIGISTMIALYYFDYTKLKKISMHIYVSAILLIAITFILVIAYAVVLITAIMRNHFGGNKKIQLMSLLAASIVPIILFICKVITTPYLLKASYVFIRESDPEYQQHMADTWLTLSNWFGKTTYQGGSLNMTMPNATGEYVLINIIATFGWAIGVALVLLIGAFIVRMFVATSKIKNYYGFYLSLSACTILSVQFIISILINFNLFPLMGVNMPFVSYGGTGYVISMAFVGIILSVWRRNNFISYEDVIKTSLEKGIISFSDGKLTIDLKAWRPYRKNLNNEVK